MPRIIRLRKRVGLSVLVEVHDQAELDVALQLEHAVLGIITEIYETLVFH